MAPNKFRPLGITASVTAIIFICIFESIASGIGAGGIVVVWTLLQLTVSLRPLQEAESNYIYDAGAYSEYGYPGQQAQYLQT